MGRMGRGGAWAGLLLCGFLLRPPPGHGQETEAGIVEDGPGAAAGACVPVAAADLIELNFEGVDIREVIHGLAAGLCLHYSVDPRVQGAVTLRTASKIRGQDLLPLFHQILRLNGIAAVKVGDIHQGGNEWSRPVPDPSGAGCLQRAPASDGRRPSAGPVRPEAGEDTHTRGAGKSPLPS